MLVRAENLRRKPNIERYHDMIRFSSESNRLYKEFEWEGIKLSMNMPKHLMIIGPITRYMK